MENRTPPTSRPVTEVDEKKTLDKKGVINTTVLILIEFSVAVSDCTC